MKKITVSVPATTANLGAGVDCMGLALNLRSKVEVWEIAQGLEVEVEGEAASQLPLDESNLIVRAAEKVFERVKRRPTGLHLHSINGVPLASGLGSSSAAIVGGLVAANALVDGRLTRTELLQMACDMEGHADNAAPTLYGGLALVSGTGEDLVAHCLTVAPIKVVIALPNVRLSTAEARAALPKEIPLKNAVYNIGHALLTAQALVAGDFDLLRRAVGDRLHEPFRKPLIPGSAEAATQACRAGAVAVTLSGAGPSLAAFLPPAAPHEGVVAAMKAAFEAAGVACRTFALPVDSQGAKLKWRLDEVEPPVWAKTAPGRREWMLEA
jgi:homoserine kinase